MTALVARDVGNQSSDLQCALENGRLWCEVAYVWFAVNGLKCTKLSVQFFKLITPLRGFIIALLPVNLKLLIHLCALSGSYIIHGKVSPLPLMEFIFNVSCVSFLGGISVASPESISSGSRHCFGMSLLRWRIFQCLPIWNHWTKPNLE